MNGQELYQKERAFLGGDSSGRPTWEELMPSIQHGWETLARQIDLWEERLRATAAE